MRVASDDWPSVACTTFSPGLADGLGDELEDELELGLAVAGLRFELGEGLEDWPDVLPAAGVAVTVGLSSRAAVLAEVALALTAWLGVFFAGCDDLPDSAADDTGGHICFEQAIMALRLTPLLAVSRITTTAIAVTSTVGKMTAQK